MAKFKSRARSLDMLGRQQIAGIPTALNELFKNAHDAYADNVDVDFFRKQNIVLIRDNGVGMTIDDFEKRWLTIGTESKLETNVGISKPYIPQNKELRPTMGEKGVGRLAIAIIGPQVLIISRAQRVDGLQEYVISFINWSMFELPGIDLDEIIIPVQQVENLTEIDNAFIDKLIQQVRNNVDNLANKTDVAIVHRIKNELSLFKFDERLLKLSYGPQLSEKGHGTFFYVQPASEDLVRDIEDEKGSEASTLHKMLCGFTNTMCGKNIPIKAEFRDHLIDGYVEDRIGEKNFFTPEDYKKVDHHLKGTFDKYGNFFGEISVYHHAPQEVKFILNKTGQELACGPFEFEFGYLQGEARSSLLKDFEYSDIYQKTDKMGGIYVYRDGIRILPYGSPDFDFLEIEQRRSKSAGVYFFSYRRMLGAISLTRKYNSSLTEKAGREGFMSNLAYRDFKNILIKFLVQLAQKYFREDGDYADEWKEEKESLNAEYKRLEKRRKKVTEKRKIFTAELDTYFSKLEERRNNDGSISSALEDTLNTILDKAEKQISVYNNSLNLNSFSEDIIALEARLYSEIKNVYSEYSIAKPSGVGLTKKLEKDWLAYNKTRETVVLPKIKNAEQKLTFLIDDIARLAKIHLNIKIRLEKSLMAIKNNSIKRLQNEENNALKAQKAADTFIQNIRKQNKKSIADLELKFDETIANISKDMSGSELEKIRTGLETDLDTVVNKINNQYIALKEALENISSIDGESVNDDIAAVETQLESMQEQYSSSLESMQIGLAIKVINHEFSSNVKSVRDSIRALHSWAKANEQLKDLYTNIRTGFDHLDNYLNLFTPLEKRFQKRATKITGKSIADFIEKLYGERLKRHNIILNVTDDFKEHNVISFAATIYPVFINLIDNSIYWISSTNLEKREINLDVKDGHFCISDTGPGISPRDADFIFDFGYTRKLNGGGMGLYIAKSILNKEGLDIILLSSNIQRGAEFSIVEKDIN